jgi:N-acetyl-D-muramate 6-phosphate phosphatase
MLREGLPIELHDNLEPLRQRFLDYYDQHICVHSVLYPGCTELLARLDAQGIAWGIVTNKPFALAQKLIDALALKPGALLGGDSLAHKKPDPAPLFAACATLGVAPANSWMVGDDPRDIEAGKRAGCAVTVACAFGYLGDSAAVDQWGATWIAHSLAELRI